MKTNRTPTSGEDSNETVPPTSGGDPDALSAEWHSAVLADVMDDLGYRSQTLRHDIQPLFAGARFGGRAATLDVVETDRMPVAPYQLLLRLLDGLKANEVVVCATQASTRAAFWGELLSTAAHFRGSVGAVVDGLCRDSERIVAMAFPVFAIGRMPADSKGRLEAVSFRQPVTVGGVLVHDGDLIFGDADGVVSIPRSIEAEVLRHARRKVIGEGLVRGRLQSGASLEATFTELGIL
jgi:regulator of RNase E activity RraA